MTTKTKKQSKSDTKTTKIVKTIVFIAIIVVIVVLIILIFRGNTTTTVNKKEATETSYIDCLASNPSDPFFVSPTAESVSHEVKVIFLDGKVSKLSYNFRGNYNSNASASKDIDNFHADYSLYLSGQNIDPESLTPNFAAINTTSEVSLFAPVSKINNVTDQFFFLSDEQSQDLANSSIDDLQNLYKSKGFLCEVGE